MNTMRALVSLCQEKDASVMSLSVQIFTVPSISLYLLEHHNALSQMMHGFVGLLAGLSEKKLFALHACLILSIITTFYFVPNLFISANF